MRDTHSRTAGRRQTRETQAPWHAPPHDGPGRSLKERRVRGPATASVAARGPACLTPRAHHLCSHTGAGHDRASGQRRAAASELLRRGSHCPDRPRAGPGAGPRQTPHSRPGACGGAPFGATQKRPDSLRCSCAVRPTHSAPAQRPAAGVTRAAPSSRRVTGVRRHITSRGRPRARRAARVAVPSRSLTPCATASRLHAPAPSRVLSAVEPEPTVGHLSPRPPPPLPPPPPPPPPPPQPTPAPSSHDQQHTTAVGAPPPTPLLSLRPRRPLCRPLLSPHAGAPAWPTLSPRAVSIWPRPTVSARCVVFFPSPRPGPGQARLRSPPRS